MLRKNVIVLVLCFLHSFISAQEVPKIHTFLSNDYNALPQNWSIIQDCEGYIFVAKTEGLLIYNGYKWKLLELPRNNRPRSVFLGKDCRVYSTGYEFFGYIDFENKNDPQYVPVADSTLDQSNQEFWNIFGNEEEIIFQSFSDVYRYDYQKLEKLKPPSNIMLGNAIGSTLFLPRIENGIYKIKDAEIDLLKGTEMLPLNSKVISVCAGSSKNEMIIATQYHGLFTYKNGQIQGINSKLNDHLKKEQINKMIQTDSGSFVIGTILNGLHITNDIMGNSLNINKSNGLANNTVLSLFEDQSNNIWVGLDKGINLLELNNPVRFFYDKNGELGSVFTSINYKNQLYIGTNQGVFYQDEDHHFNLIPNSQGQVWSFVEVDGDLICGHNSGSYHIKDHDFVKISDVTGGWASRMVSSKRILQSTYTGLVLLEKSEGSWQFKSRIESGDVLIMDFELDNNTLVGYHPYYGICILNLSDNLDKVIDQNFFGEINSVPITDEVQIIKSKIGVIINLENEFFLLRDMSFHALKASELTTLQSDSIWIAQNNYIDSVNKLKDLTNVGNLRFNKPRNESEYFLVGSEEGYVSVPNKTNIIGVDLTGPSIDYVLVNGNLVNEEGIFNIELEAHENDISIQLKRNDFNQSGQEKFFLLENWDSKWFEVPPGGLINFFNLQNGKYNLFINGNQTKDGVKFTFELKPHWYESWPGYLMYGLSIFIVILFVNKRQKNKWLKKENELQEQKEKELESERIKARYTQLEKEVTYKNKMLANSTMTLVQKNKMLIDLKSEIAKEPISENQKRISRQKLIHLINKNINSDHDWEIFESTFAEVHEDFLEKLKESNPSLTSGDLRLAAYIKMNLSSKEIAPLMNISLRSIENKRYRLRKKIGISHDSNLKEFLFSME